MHPLKFYQDTWFFLLGMALTLFLLARFFLEIYPERSRTSEVEVTAAYELKKKNQF